MLSNQLQLSDDRKEAGDSVFNLLPVPRYLDLSLINDANASRPDGVEIISTLDGLDGLEDDWRLLEKNWGKSFNLFQSFDWCRTWARLYASPDNKCKHELAIAVVRDQGQAKLIWPMMRIWSGPVCTLRWLSDPWGQYGDILLDPSRRSAERVEDAWEALKSISCIDVIRLRHVRHDAAIYQFLAANACRSSEHDTAPYLDLAEFPDEKRYDKRYSKQQRKRRKRIRDELEKRGPVEFCVTPAGETQDGLIDQVILQKREWLETRGLYSRPLMSDQTGTLFRELSRSMDDLQVVVSHTKAGDEVVASEVGLRFKGRHCGYLTAHDNALTNLSPARLHMDMSQRRAIADGMMLFDLMVPGDPHKSSWSNGCVEVSGFYAPVTKKGRIYGELYLEKMRPLAREIYMSAPRNLRKFLTAPFSG